MGATSRKNPLYLTAVLLQRYVFLDVQTTVKTVNCHAYLSSQWAKHVFGCVDIDLFKIATILIPFTGHHLPTLA